MKKTLLIATLATLAILTVGCSSFWNEKLSQAAVREGGEAYRHGKYSSALSHFNNGVSLDPRNTDALVYRAAAYTALGRLDDAIADLDKALSINPNLPDAYFQRAEARRIKGNLRQAAADYTSSIKLNPDNAKALFQRASIYAALGEHRNAAADLRKFLKFAPYDNNAKKLLSDMESINK